ncbi:MAG: hypothetical protein KGO50_08615 [Myxococcales bacterium]|nr:hypothetical protein [Myxococcales bacterium]
MARLFAGLLVAALLVAAPVHVRAQDDPEVEVALAQAYDDYDMLDLDAARAGLEASIERIRANGIRSVPAAETFIMYGVVLFAVSGDASVTTGPFVEGLLIDSSVQVHPYYATPTLIDMLDQARALVPTNTGTPPPAEPVVQTPPVQPVVQTPPTQPTPPVVQPQPQQPAGPSMAHRAVRNAVAGDPVIIGVSIPPSLAATQIRVQFRPLGDTQYYAAPLLPQGDPYTFFGEIPAAATANSVQIDYFIEALDARGFLLESIGNPAQPIAIMVQRASDSAEDAMGDAPRRDRSQRSSGAAPRRDPPQRSSGASRTTEMSHRLHLALGGGTGVGLATAPPNVYSNYDLNPGLASSPLQLAFEVGIAVTPAVEIVPFTRMQLVFLETGITLEPMFGLKGRYYAINNPRTRFYLEGGAGYGEVSHLVYISQEEAYDTTDEGPAHIGAGIGGVLLVTEQFGFQPSIYLMSLFPEFSVHLDATLSLYVEF